MDDIQGVQAISSNPVAHGAAIVVLILIVGIVLYKKGFFGWARDKLIQADDWFRKHY